MNSVTIYIGYMSWAFDYDACKRIFGSLTEHVWQKWMDARRQCGGDYVGASAVLWTQIDNDCRRHLMAAAETKMKKTA